MSAMKFEPDWANLTLNVDGTVTPLPYDPSSAERLAWHYDNEELPTQLELCVDACALARQGQANDSNELRLVVGCAKMPTPN
jgi:hypothetical protein